MPSPRSRAAPLAAALALLAVPRAVAQDDSPTFKVAIGLLQRGLHEEAAVQFRAFLAERPRDPRASEARYRLGTCELECGRAAAAVEAFEAALIDRTLALRPECLYRLGGALQGLGRHADAAARYAQLLEEVGEAHYLAAAAHFGGGEALRDGGDDARAAVQFAAAAARAGDDDAAGYRFAGLYQAGFAKLRAGDAAGAAELFGAVAQRFPEHEARGEVLRMLGEAEFRRGRLGAAEAAWQRSLEAGGPQAADARSGIAWVRRQRGDAAGALEAFRELVGRNPDSPLVPAGRVEIGRLLLERGDAAAAVPELDPLADGASTAPEVRRQALEVRGLALLELGDVERARASLARAAEGASQADAARLGYGLAECDAAVGRWDAALGGYERAARAADASLRGDALYGQVLALHALGRHDESARRAEELLRLAPEHRLAPYAAFAIAENLFAQGRHADALARFDALGPAHPLGADARHKAAWCAWLAGDARDALRRFRAIAEDAGQPGERRDEGLSMAALAALSAGAPDDALALADTYRARHPKGEYLARTERVAARVLRDRGELGAAAERLKRAATAAGDGGADIALERADVLLASGDYKAASAAFAQHASRDDAGGARAIEGLAWCAFELGDDAACLRWIDAGVAHPAGADVSPGLRELAVTVHHRAKRWSEAVAAAGVFLAAFPSHARAPEVRYALGVAQSRGGEPDAARATLERAVREGGTARPDLALYELAWACKNLGDLPAARAAFAQVTETSPERELADECRVRVAELDLAAGERARAREALAAVEHPVHRGRARYLTAQCFLADGRLDAALDGFRAVVELGPEEPLYADALFAAGETAHRAGRFADAAALLGRTLAEDAQGARAARAELLLGECQARQGQTADAVGTLRGYLERDGEEPAARARGALWLGRALQARGELGEAEAAFAQAVAQSQGDVAAEAQFRIGEVRRAAGDLTGAADAFVRVSILYAHEEWVPKGLLAAGECFVALGQPAKATRLWQELVERHGASAEAKAVRSKVGGGGR